MSMTAQDVVTRATVLLNDAGNTAASVAANTRWPVSEMLLWVTDAQRGVVVFSPHAYNIVARVPLVAGTRQQIPANGWLLLSVKRNLNASGAASRAIRQVEASLLDAYNPDWHTDTPAAVVWDYTFDVEDHKAFYVYPPNDGTGFVEANYSAIPAAVTTLTDELELDDVYLGALASYVAFRSLTKDAEYAGGAALAAQFYQDFMTAVTGMETSEKDDSPSATFATMAPSMPVAVPPPAGRR